MSNFLHQWYQKRYNQLEELSWVLSDVFTKMGYELAQPSVGDWFLSVHFNSDYKMILFLEENAILRVTVWESSIEEIKELRYKIDLKHPNSLKELEELISGYVNV